MISWIFPSNNDGQINGIADSGIEMFTGAPIKSLAREICQNSLDATLENDEPARVCFSTFEIPTQEVPGFETLHDAFKKGLAFWQLQSSDKAKKFYTQAISACVQPTITCLRISDFNTSGLTGSDQKYNTPWCNLTKSSGASDKTETNGGSFGIGKHAPFACSTFRTVFYSTLEVTGKKAYQGVSHLTSFEIDSDTISQGIGYYGEDRCSPVYEEMMLDPGFTRGETETGTDIYVVGFIHNTEWKKELIASVLDGFLYAVYRGDLIVTVDDIVVSKDTLPALMEEYKNDFSEYANEYYTVLTSDEEMSPKFEKDIKGMGNVILRMMIQPDMHRRCAMIRRTGMKIMDKDHISGTIPFAAVLYVEGERLNGYLRDLENPQHTAWQIKRAENESKARGVISEITGFIKACLEQMRQLETADSIDPAVGEYLAFTDEEGKQPPEERSEAVSDAVKNVTLKVTPPVTPNNSNIGQEGNGNDKVDAEDGDIIEEGLPGEGSGASSEYGEGGGDFGEGGGSEEGTSNGTNPGGNTGENPIEHRRKLMSVAPAKERTVCMDKTQGKYRITFTPSVNVADGYMKVYQAAESQEYDAVLLNVTCDSQEVSFKGNTISGFNLEAKKPITLTIQIDYSDYCALEVKAYGYKV